jgi:N-acetylglucosaminyldiphosphoundecaprenol N-acetyl-beta-D-mannosaminyltransferase
VGLGAPKQEFWIHAHGPNLSCPVAICAGATIDFLAGERRRAPLWMQRTGTEWLYRALSEPRRLIPRYARGACYLPLLLYEDWKASSGISTLGKES